MWSPIKYLFGESNSGNETSVDRSFWGQELNESNRIKQIAFVTYIIGWLEKHKGRKNAQYFLVLIFPVQDSIEILKLEGNTANIRRLSEKIKQDSMLNSVLLFSSFRINQIATFRFNDQTDSLLDVLGVLVLFLKEMKSNLVNFSIPDIDIEKIVSMSYSFLIYLSFFLSESLLIILVPRDRTKRLVVLRSLISHIPDMNKEMLSLICSFLNKVRLFLYLLRTFYQHSNQDFYSSS
jgi:hypothetical protein